MWEISGTAQEVNRTMHRSCGTAAPPEHLAGGCVCCASGTVGRPPRRGGGGGAVRWGRMARCSSKCRSTGPVVDTAPAALSVSAAAAASLVGRLGGSRICGTPGDGQIVSSPHLLKLRFFWGELALGLPFRHCQQLAGGIRPDLSTVCADRSPWGCGFGRPPPGYVSRPSPARHISYGPGSRNTHRSGVVGRGCRRAPPALVLAATPQEGGRACDTRSYDDGVCSRRGGGVRPRERGCLKTVVPAPA